MAGDTATSNILPPRRERTGFGWRVSVSIVTVFGWVSFLLLYFAFWAGAFSVLQSVVIFVVSILVFVAANGAAWAPWGARYAEPPTP